MKKKIIILSIIAITLLAGCSKNETFESYFNSTMNEMHIGETDYSYSLVYKELNVVNEEDAIAIFVEKKHQEKTIFIAYFEKLNGKWTWRQTRGATFDEPIKWWSMNHIPYIYSGYVRDESIAKVYAGEKRAKIIKVEGDKRFWFAISDVKDVQVKVIKDNGSEEILEQTQGNWIKKDY